MTKFDRYLLRTLFASILVALIFLLGIDFLVRSSEESAALSGKYTFSILALSLILQIPSRTIEFMPAAVLVGTIMGLGQLNAQNELTVVRTSGVSRLRMSRSGILLALILGSLLIAIGEYISPKADAKSELIVNQAKGLTSQTLYNQGTWLSEGNNRMVHIGKFNKDGSIGNLRFYQRQANGDIHIREANKAHYQQTQWQLENVRSFSLSPQGMQTLTSDNHWQNAVTPATLYAIANTKTANTIHELITLTQFLRANHLNDNSQQLLLWQRLFLPLSTLTMILLALPFAFSQRRGGGGGSRLVIGILLGVCYYISQGIISNLAVLLNWPPLLGAILPIALLGIPPLLVLLKD